MSVKRWRTGAVHRTEWHVMREAKGKFKRAIEEEKLPSTECMNSVMSHLYTMHKSEKLFNFHKNISIW
jgi:hypothetical protein